MRKSNTPHGKTITVSELRELLSIYPEDMPVFAEWESVHAYISNEDMQVCSVKKGAEYDNQLCLVIDVNYY